jgi:serine/threonine-protein phosphatase PGAM5
MVPSSGLRSGLNFRHDRADAGGGISTMKTSGGCLRLLAIAAMLVLGAAGEPARAADPPAMHTIVLVRHGQYVEVPGGDERTGMGLSPLGVAQARLAGARLAAWPQRFDGQYVSPLRRARETAAAIGESLPSNRFDIDEDLAECTPATRRTEVTKDEKPADLAACQAQLDRVFSRYFTPAAGAPRTDLLVCHGNVIRYLVTRALGVDTQAWLEMSVGHASITVIRVEPDGRMKVISAGDVGHIPPGMLTGTTGDPVRNLAAPALP